MIEFGKTLREAREAKGYGVSQLAEITHILPQIIENLEREDFTKIVAPIYGRGFVKLYCETVGIDPKPLVAEFMEIYNGNRPPVIRMREMGNEAENEGGGGEEAKEEDRDQVEVQVEGEATGEACAEPPIEEPKAEEAPPEPEPMKFDFEAKDEPPPVTTDMFAKPLPKAEPFKAGPDDLPFPDEPLPKRDYRLPGYSMPDMPRRYWRFGVLLAAAIGVLLLIFFSCRALYRITMGTGAEAERVENVEKTSQQPTTRNKKQDTKKAKPAAPRKGVKAPPLYID